VAAEFFNHSLSAFRAVAASPPATQVTAALDPSEHIDDDECVDRCGL